MLKGKCALITGSTQGLGYAMAERLAAEGCNIVMNGFGDPAEIESRRVAHSKKRTASARCITAPTLPSRSQIADLMRQRPSAASAASTS